MRFNAGCGSLDWYRYLPCFPVPVVKLLICQFPGMANLAWKVEGGVSLLTGYQKILESILTRDLLASFPE